MASEARYKLLSDDFEPNYYFKVQFPRLSYFVVSLPFSAFVFCIVYSVVFNFESSTGTSCHAKNYLPSVSAAIGGYSPQKEVWKAAILLHAPVRFMMVWLYKRFNVETVTPRMRALVNFAAVLHFIENASLISLSVYDSSNYYPIHEKSFIIFIITSELYMILLIVLQNYFRLKPRNISERRGLKLKKLSVSINILAILFATYYFIVHNTYCHDYVYSKFAIFEYIVVVSNMVFHFTALYDFRDKDLVVSKNGFKLVHRYS